MNLVLYGNPEGDVPHDEVEADDAAASPDPRMVEALESPESSPEFVHVPADKLAEVLTRPIEDWMVYLDPDQQALVDRDYNGPARIRGAAGTGKTVVALHRARRLAAGGGRVLITMYVRNLPEVYDRIFARWAPHERGRVEFAGVHSWALTYLRRHHIPVRLDPKAATTAWATAASAFTGPAACCGAPGSRLPARGGRLGDPRARPSRSDGIPRPGARRTGHTAEP
jgi:hypothetical protein